MRFREWWRRVTHQCRTPWFSQEYAREHPGERWTCVECGTEWLLEWVEDPVALEGTAVADIGGYEWTRE